MRRLSETSRAARALSVFVPALAIVVVASLALAAVAGADAISPEAGPSDNAVKTDTLYKIVFGLGLGVIALVWGVLFYSIVRFRARRGRVAPQIRGNTPLELGWTIGASVLVTVVAVVMLFMLDDIRDPAASGPIALADIRGQNAATSQPPPPDGDALNVKVSGQQFLWRYQYPNGAVSFHDLVVPKDTTVTLDITSNDVAHSWWIPKLGGKQDAIRGLTNETWFKATETGTFTGQCAEFCGDNHAFMTAKVIVVEPARFEQWAENQKKLVADAQKQGQEQRKRLGGG
jgi:cytochrome c oxidase subunit 2